MSTVLPDFIPILTANLPGKRRGQVIVFFELWLTLVLIYITNFPYYYYMFTGHPWMFIFIPISIYGLIWELYLFTTGISWVVYRILCLFEPPKEGIFPINGREYRFYLLRFWVCYYAIYVARAMPLPWADFLLFRAFGTKIGHNVVLYDSWIDPEFVEIHDFSMISLNTQLFSHCIYEGYFIVKKIIIGKAAIAGASAIVAPGTIIEEGAVLGANCSTRIDQRLAAYCIHVGTPANIALPIKIMDDQL